MTPPETVETEFKTIEAEDFGRMLTGFGINLLVRDVIKCCEFLHQVFSFEILQESADYAILRHQGTLYQLHADSTYHSHPLPSMLPENAPRGAGAEFRLYGVDPDQAEERAKAFGTMVLQETMDKPHGLRECFLLDPDGYCWVPSVPKQNDK